MEVFFGRGISDNPIINAIFFVSVAAAVVLRIWKDIRKEIDISSGMSREDVQKYHNRLYHSKKTKEEYQQKRMETCDKLKFRKGHGK